MTNRIYLLKPTWIAGVPVAQPRIKTTRFTKKGGGEGVRGYTPDEVNNRTGGSPGAWRRAVRTAVEGLRPLKPYRGAVGMSMVFHLPRVEAGKRKSSPVIPIWSPVRPDCDNLQKLVQDVLGPDKKLGLVGFWHDDGQVCAWEGTKHYGMKEGFVGALVSVWVLE